MPFIDLSLPEREMFLRSFTGCHIPGYTGHCPTLKFHYGRCFGTDTRAIIKEIKERPRPVNVKYYKHGDFWDAKGIQRDKGEEPDPMSLLDQSRRFYILGYTGFIPGLNFRYGSSFSTAANESVAEFTQRLHRERARRKREEFECVNAIASKTSVRNADDVDRVLHHGGVNNNNNNNNNNYNNQTSRTSAQKISLELPPIAGYTGHIPRLIGSETSLSHRYHVAAKAGLARLKTERDRRRHMDLAKEAVKNAIACSRSS